MRTAKRKRINRHDNLLIKENGNFQMTRTNYTFVRRITGFHNNAHNKPKKIKNEKQKLLAIICDNGTLEIAVPLESMFLLLPYFFVKLYIEYLRVKDFE